NDDDDERSNSLDDNIISGLPLFSAITPDEPVLSTEEPDNSLSIGDEQLDTTPATESDEFINSGVETLIPILSESEGIPEHVCDVPSHDNSPPLDVSKYQIEDFSESNEEFSSTDDDSFSFDKIDYVEASPPDSELFSSKGDMLLFEAFLDDDHSSDFKTKSASTSFNSLLEETNNFNNSLLEFTTFSNVLCDAEYESDSSDDQSCSDEDVLEKIVSKPLSEEEIIPMESQRTHDSSLPISSKIDSLLDVFAGELTLLKSIPRGIDETDCDFEEDIRLIKKLLYDNSSPRQPKEFVYANSDVAIKSFSHSPILVKDSDSLMEEIDLFCTPDYPMPLSIVDKDYDSKRDILIPKDLPSNNSLSFAEKESFHFDIPLFSRPPAKPPDGDTGFLNIKMMGDIYDQKAFMHKLMITLASHQEKSPDLLSFRCGTVKKFNTHRSHLNKCPMLIHGQNNPPLDNRSAFYDDDDDDDVDYTIAIAPVLSPEEPVDSLSIPDTMCDVHLINNPTPLEAKDHFEIVINSNDDISSSDDDSLYKENIEYVDSELVSLEVAEIVISEEEEIEDDNLREKLLNVHLLIPNIEALKDDPTPSSKFLTKSSSISSKSFLEEANTFHNSLPEFENFCFDLEEISSGSTTTHSDISLSDYEVFHFDDDHIEEINSGSTTTHSYISLSEYDLFIFDLANDQFPPTDRSNFTHEEFVDELAHIISPPEYDCFYFKNLPDPGELISIFNFRIRENLSTTCVNLPIEDDHSPLLAYVVWIFLAYLTYLVIPPYLHQFENEDTIFDPGITINRFYSFKPGLSHRIPENVKTLAKGFYPPSLNFLSFN
nr:hypothetical protein [Tanacetum cinerariifolium]